MHIIPMQVFKTCKECQKSFHRLPTTKIEKWKIQKFCSQQCYWKARKGGKGIYTGYWTGKKIPKEMRSKISQTLKKRPFTRRKKDEDIGYHQKHKLLTKISGKPQSCEFCNKQGEMKNGRWTIEWAKKQGHEYTVKVEDYLALCHKCHYHYDWKMIE